MSAEEACQEALDKYLAEANEEGGLMSEFVEKLALMEDGPRQVMLGYYGRTIPKEISEERREVGLLSVKWMLEKRMERNEEMNRERAISDGRKRGMFQEGSGPDDKFDFGKHQGWTFREMYLLDDNYCEWTVRQEHVMRTRKSLDISCGR